MLGSPIAHSKSPLLHRAAFAAHRELDAGARRHAVDLDGAGAANAMLAAQVGAGEALVFAQEIRQMGARLDFRGDRLAVDDEVKGVHAVASAMARRNATACIWNS